MGRAARLADQWDERPVAEPERCWLCERELGAKVERHHPVPKSRGGKATAPVHPLCHRALHAHFTNKELEAIGDDPAKLRTHGELGRFVCWVADKDPDFWVPTRRKKG